jgi:serine/threonine-protein kinase
MEQVASALADRYRIERELGQGGMATVYLAQDLKHHRKVAIKVLKPELAAVIGAERFLREIQTVAALQHPHILGLIDSGAAEVERSGGQAVERSTASFLVYYVMPYVDGESLRERLSREKQLPIPDAIRIASEVASALDYAHRHGVIHRDIKPENILLHDGSALVADFGIALAMNNTAGYRMTETGMSLGTPQYMSPEQAMGEREIGPRSDVYALGAVTYEMLTGDPPFTGNTAQAIVAKVMTEKPTAIRRVRERVPPSVEDAVFTALEKLPADRFATAAEFASALNSGVHAADLPSRRAAEPAHLGTRRLLGLTTSVAVLGLAAAAWLFVTRPHAAPAAVARYQVPAPGLKTADQLFIGAPFALSPDGSRLAYVANVNAAEPVLMLRNQGDITAHQLAGTEGADNPFFSPDGQWIAYVAHQKLYKVSADRGAPVELAQAQPVFAPGGAWRGNGAIIFNSGPTHLLSVPADGGPVDTVATMEPLTYAAFPATVPGTDVVLVTECSNNCAHMDVAAYNLRNHQRKLLLPNTARAWVLPGNLLIAVRVDGTVVGGELDPAALALSGDPVPLLNDVAMAAGVTPEMSVSGNGTLVYLPRAGASDDVTPVRMDRAGRVSALDPAWHDYLQYPSLSPDGRQLAVNILTQGRMDIWVKQLPAGPLTRLTFDGVLNYRPAWTSDGRSFSYSSDRDGLTHLFLLRGDGSSQPQRLMPYDTTQVDESLWSHDGRWLVYRAGVVNGKRDIYARAVTGDTTRLTVADSPNFDEYTPAVSPDGHWLAYVSDESGREQVFVRPFPDAGRSRLQVSTAGGTQPAWSHSGRELFFVSASDSLIAVDVSGSSASDFRPGAHRALFSLQAGHIATLAFHRSYEVTPDDRGFIMLQVTGATRNTDSNLTIVLNWLDEVRRQVRR